MNNLKTPDSSDRLHISLHHPSLNFNYMYKTKWAFFFFFFKLTVQPLEREHCEACLLSLYLVFSGHLRLLLQFLLCTCYSLTLPKAHITVTFTLSLLITSVASVQFTATKTTGIWVQVLCSAGLSTWVSESQLFFLFSFAYLCLLFAIRLRHKGLEFKK